MAHRLSWGVRLCSTPLPKGKLFSKQGHLRLQKSGCCQLRLQTSGFSHQQQKERSHRISRSWHVLGEWWFFGVRQWHVRNTQRLVNMHKLLRCSLCFWAQLQLFRNGILRWRRKNICSTSWPNGWQRSGAEPERFSCEPSMDATLPAALGRGKSRSQIAQQKNTSCWGSQGSLFFWFPHPGDKAGSHQTVSLTYTCLTARREGAGEPDHLLGAGKRCRRRLPSCKWARLRNAWGPRDVFTRKEEENSGKRSQKEGGKVCKNESGLISGASLRAFPANNQAFLVTK